MIISEIIRKWFGLGEPTCAVCEVLRTQLDESNRERLDLLRRVLAPSTPESPQSTSEMRPILPQRIPWSVRQQMLEAEDRAQAKILREKQAEIDQLEKEVGISG